MCSRKSCASCESERSDTCASCRNNAISVLPAGDEFSAKKFVDNLLTKGSCLACDESSNTFNNNKLPPYYDEDMYKRGQALFYKHLFGMLIGCLLGLLCNLATKSGLAVLILTNMSSSNFTAYKRYMATIFHMMIWYDSDFKPGSRLWKSIEDVKFKHNTASKKSLQVLKYRISQKDMALTQFGFMGLAVSRSNLVGVYEKDDKELKCFIHLWRVIGYVLGIEEQFNICRESLEETKAICDELIKRVFKPEVQKKDEEHHKMVSYLLNGLWAINPFLKVNTFLFYLDVVLENNYSLIDKQNIEYKKLTCDEKRRVYVIIFVTRMLRFPVIRIILKYQQIISLWIARNFPFLAYYLYGRSNAHVKVIGVR